MDHDANFLPREHQIQFNQLNAIYFQVDDFTGQAANLDMKVEVFGRSKDNARVFWNLNFLSSNPDQPKARATLNRSCDVRLPSGLSLKEIDAVAQTTLDAIGPTMEANRCNGRP